MIKSSNKDSYIVRIISSIKQIPETIRLDKSEDNVTDMMGHVPQHKHLLLSCLSKEKGKCLFFSLQDSYCRCHNLGFKESKNVRNVRKLRNRCTE